MSDQVVLEVCADSVESAVAAQRGGAHRIELCSGLIEGGITPSSGLISTVRSRVSIPICVMVRPRAGDFCYSAEEFETMKQDVLMAKRLGADAIVFGILQEDGEIDTTRTRCLIEIARPLKVTFHRAFDMSRDLTKSLHDVIESGADRVLTSGGEQSVEDGVPAIADLMRRAAGKIAIMIGGGITPANVRAIIEATGVHEIHASVRVQVPSPMRHRNEKISMGMAQGREYQRVMVFEDEVRRLAESANHGSQHRAKVH